MSETGSQSDWEFVIQQETGHGQEGARELTKLLSKANFDLDLIRQEGILSLDVGEGMEIGFAEYFSPARLVVSEPPRGTGPDVLNPASEPERQFPLHKILTRLKSDLPKEVGEKVEIWRLSVPEALDRAREQKEQFALVTLFNVFPPEADRLEKTIPAALELTVKNGLVLASVLPEELPQLERVGRFLTQQKNLTVKLQPLRPTTKSVALTALGSHLLLVSKK